MKPASSSSQISENQSISETGCSGFMCRCKFVGRFAHFHSERTFLIRIVSQNGGAKDMENSLAEVRPDLAREWSDRNLKLTPDDVSYGSTINVWWKGACRHEWVAPVCNRLRQYGAGCPYCAGRRLLRGFNDLATKFPDVAAEWSEKISLKRRTMCWQFQIKRRGGRGSVATNGLLVSQTGQEDMAVPTVHRRRFWPGITILGQSTLNSQRGGQQRISR